MADQGSVVVSPASVAIIIPVYNEEESILSVLNPLLEAGYQIIVVDDGSERPVSALLDTHKVHCLRHGVNLGQGAALQTGFEFAIGLPVAFCVTLDGDGQHVAEDIPRLLKPLVLDKADISLGSRFLAAGSGGVPVSRKLVLQVARLVNLILSGLWLSDAHNGFRAVNRKALTKIKLTENRMAHATEILFELKRHRLRFIEVPVSVHYTAYSKAKGQSAWDSIRIVFDLILHKLFK